MKQPITSRGLQIIAIVAMLGVAAALLIQRFGPFRRQLENMAAAEEHISVLGPILQKDARYTNIALHPFTGSGGSLSVAGQLLSQSYLQDLKRIVERSRPPVKVVYHVNIIPLELQKELDRELGCGNQMHAILFVAALEWPSEHGGYLPTNFVSMSNELTIPKLLICPADHSREPAASWSSFSADHCSYEILTLGLRQGDTNSVFLRCKIHGYTGYADDRLFDRSGKLITKNRL